MSMRKVKIVVQKALQADDSITVPDAQIFAVERAVLPSLPSIEVIGVSSERVDTGPLVRHELSCEITVSHVSEDGADEQLDGIVTVVRERLAGAAYGSNPIVLADGSVGVVELQGTRWSMSASGPSSVIRGAAVSVFVGVNDEDE